MTADNPLPDLIPRISTSTPDLHSLSAAERTSRIADLICHHLARELDLDPASVTPDTPFEVLRPAWAGHVGLRSMHPVIQIVVEHAVNRAFYRYEFFNPGRPGYKNTARKLATYLADTIVISTPSGTFSDPHENGQWRWVLPRASADPTEKAPPVVFVLSSPRSGSTLLRTMLAGHPDLFAPPELYLLMFESMAERKVQMDANGYYWMSFGLINALEMMGATEEEAARWLAQVEADDLPVGQIYRALRQRAGGRMLVDKTITYPMHPQWLQRAERMCREPKYLHIVRHPCAVIESIVRLHFQGTAMGNHFGVWDDNPWLFAEKWWTVSCRNSMNFLESIPLDRQHTLRYEDLVADPEPEMLNVCAFLNIPFHNAVLDPYAGSRKQDGLGDPNLITRNRVDPALASAWKKNRPPQALSTSTRRVAEELGYEL